MKQSNLEYQDQKDGLIALKSNSNQGEICNAANQHQLNRIIGFLIVVCVAAYAYLFIFEQMKEQLKGSQIKRKQVSPSVNVVPQRKFTYEITPEQIRNAIKFHVLKDDPKNKISKVEYQYYENKYNFSKYQELPFCIVMNSYNNAAQNRVTNSLNSVFFQNYTNYHIVYIDDLSTDNTLALVYQYIQKNPSIKHKITVIHNKKNMGINYNYLLAANDYCKREEIFTIVDGDDEILGLQTLKVFNAAFQQTKPYFIYSNLLFSDNQIGYSVPFPDNIIKDNQYRRFPFISGHLQAFYTELLLKVDEKNFKDRDGKWFKTAGDVALSIPLLELSHERILYLPELTYYYNRDTGLNDATIRYGQQKAVDNLIRDYPKLQPLDRLYDQNPYDQIGFVVDVDEIDEVSGEHQ